MKKLSRFLALLVCCCCFSTGWAQLKKTSVNAGVDCASAPDISSSIGVDANGKVTAIVTNNFSKGAGSTPACWGTTADSDGWLSFSVPDSGLWSISTDNGINNFLTDAQIALYVGCSGAPIACDEDLSADANVDEWCYDFAAGFTLALDDSAGGAKVVYKLQFDVWDTDTGKITFTIFETKRPLNDCILNAYSVDYGYDNKNNCFAADGWFVYNPYNYVNDATDLLSDPTYSAVDNDDSSCTSAISTNSEGLRHDIWFTFVYDNSCALTSIYSMNGCILYVLEAYKKTGPFDHISCPDPDSSSATGISNLVRVGCSVPDGFPESEADEGNWAAGDFFDHPRINLKEGGAMPGDTIYLRVYQYPRILIDLSEPAAPDTLVADPEEGLLKVVFEACPSDSCHGKDRRTADNSCCVDTCLVHLPCLCHNDSVCEREARVDGLCNAGMRGGMSAAEGSTANPDGRRHEPVEYLFTGEMTSRYNCSEEETVTANVFELYNNNSAYYRFKVCPPYKDSVDISDIDTLFGVGIDSIHVLAGDTLITPEVWAGIILCKKLIKVEEAHGEVLNTPIPPLCVGVPDILFDDCCLKMKCVPRVELCFQDLKFCGVNGSRAEFFILPVDKNCDDSIAPAVAYGGEIPLSSCDTCLCTRTTIDLPPGEYDLVVDGESGSLVEFDLVYKVSYVIAGTDICCKDCEIENACGDTLKTKDERRFTTGVSNFDLGVKPTSLVPIPASNYVDLGYIAAIDGKVQYTMLDISGKVVESGSFDATKGENKHRFNTEGYSDGMYVLSMVLNGMETQMKLMISKNK